MKYNKLLITAMVAGAMMSCSTTRENNLAYFKNAGEAVTGVLPQGQPMPEIKIVTDDELSIVVSSMAPEATAMFNAPLTNTGSRGDTEVSRNNRLTTYTVDHDGNITMPVIGKLNVLGKTTRQVEQLVHQQVAKVVKDAFVKVELVGFYVDVMGEVKEPQRIKVTGERFSVLDALAACGDLTEFAERGSLIVVREENGQKTYTRLNLSDTNIFTSPCFYLQQNDVVYVEPNTIKIDNSKYNTNNAYKLSVISTVVSAASVIASLVIALSVKR